MKIRREQLLWLFEAVFFPAVMLALAFESLAGFWLAFRLGFWPAAFGFIFSVAGSVWLVWRVWFRAWFGGRGMFGRATCGAEPAVPPTDSGKTPFTNDANVP